MRTTVAVCLLAGLALGGISLPLEVQHSGQAAGDVRLARAVAADVTAEVDALLRDERAANALATEELEQRLQVMQAALEYVEKQRTGLILRLKADRAEAERRAATTPAPAAEEAALTADPAAAGTASPAGAAPEPPAEVATETAEPVPAPEPANRPRPKKLPLQPAVAPEPEAAPGPETPEAESAPAAPSAGDKRGTRRPIDDATWAAMQGKSWRPNMGCPPRASLALLRVPYIDFAGDEQMGDLIVADEVADDILAVFATLHAARFPIASMRLMDKFAGNDDASMAANNTSAFNCRAVTGGKRLSEHSFGKAIDLNPVQNPYVTRTRTLPPAGARFAKARQASAPGVVTAGSVAVKAFASIGWSWGGAWNSTKDYQHFSKSGR